MQTIAVSALRIVTRLLDGRLIWGTCGHGRMFVIAIALALPILTSLGITTVAAADAVEAPPDDGLLTLKVHDFRVRSDPSLALYASARYNQWSQLFL